MKHIWKKVAAMLLAAALLASLCGCDALDEMRKNQAILQDDGTIVWNGSIYRKLPYSEYLSPEMNLDDYIYVTMPDVPVLLSTTEWAIITRASKDGRFLQYNNNYGYEDYYCRAEEYDALEKRLKEEFVPEVVCFYYAVVDEETWETEQKYHLLTDEQVKMLKDVTANVEPVSGNQMGVPQYESIIYLDECSKDMLLQRSVIALARAGQQYYLQLSVDGDKLIFAVPEACNEAANQIFRAYAEVWGRETEDIAI